MIAESHIVKKSPRIAARVVDGAALIVVIQSQKLHRLNDVGTHVWELCDGRSVGELADAVVEAFEVERDQALDDVRAFVSELLEVGALESGESA